jgi:antitoxin (DNA-binding transcriptional repressor) of toxin-antitoxin stability system
MKSASVADLRNNFAAVSRWIYEGESVAIEKRGKAFAVLSPVRRRHRKTVALPDYEGRLRRIFRSRLPGGAAAEELVDRLRGEY